MKYIITIILFIAFPLSQVQAQTINDTIQKINTKTDTIYDSKSDAEIIQPVFANDSITITTAKGGDIRGYKNGYLLTIPDYKDLFRNNPEALHEIKVANFDYKFGLYLDYIGGFVVGFCLGSAINGDHLDASWGWTLGTGAAMAGLGMIIYSSGKSHHRKAVDIYNSAHRKQNLNETGELKIGFTNSGLGLAYRF
jgi:hypothetical protein